MLSVAISVACGGGDDSDQGQGQEGTPVRAGSRLGWDQAASSIDEIRSLSFQLYVDNLQSTLSDVRCADVPTATGFACSGALPNMSAGRHQLELTTVQNGVESSRSGAIVVEFSASALVTSAPISAVDSPPQNAGSLCSVAPPVQCYDSVLVASGLEPVTTLSAAPDGRIFFVEGERRVRVLAGNAIVPEAALTLDQTDSRIVGLAVDTSFASTRTVYVAWTDPPAGGSSLNITRYREVQNTLGEGATIVTGLPFRTGALAPLAVDAAGLLYAALPSVDGAGSGVVVRFTREGSVPRENPRSLPGVTEGHAMPTALGIDRQDGRVWMVGRSPDGREGVASFAPSTGRSWPINRISVMEPSQTRSDDGLLIGTSTSVLRTSSASNGTPELVEEVRLASGSELLAAAEAANRSVYVAVVNTENDRSTSSILLLTNRH
jgi:hypothetical protein